MTDPTLTYEETPIITPQSEPQPPEPQPQPAPRPTPKPNTFFKVIKSVLFIGILFTVGFFLSGYISDWITRLSEQKAQLQQQNQQTVDIVDSTPTASLNKPSPEPPTTSSVLSGVTRKPVEGISFSLPSSVLPLICDGSACGSQGTYLPGGTRFTVAARGAGQVLSDFRGKIISDAGGKAFTTSTTSVAGKPATEFTTSQTGSTIGGYAFSRMHGYMIEVTDTLSLEINHFSPSGIATDFEKDEEVFAAIIQSLMFSPTK